MDENRFRLRIRYRKVGRLRYLSPDSTETPTLGRERGFFEDLFGNIGAVGAAGPAPQGGPNG